MIDEAVRFRDKFVRKWPVTVGLSLESGEQLEILQHLSSPNRAARKLV
jgi:hypothetical protein